MLERIFVVVVADGQCRNGTMIKSLLSFFVLSVMATQFIAELTFQLYTSPVSLLVICNYSHACSVA